MKFGFFLPLVLAAVFLNASCRRNSGHMGAFENFGFSDSEVPPQPPAATAEEWIERLDDGTSLENGYAELPPQDQWDGILETLRKPGNDPLSLKRRLFGEILADDTDAVEASIRALLLTDPDELKGYSREDSFKYLHAFSKDPAATAQWVEKSLPKADAEKDYTREPDEVEKLLLANQIDEAMTKLREKIDAEDESKDKVPELARLAKISRLTGKQESYRKAMGELKIAAMKIEPSDVYGIYLFTSALEELALSDDWQAIRQLAARYRKGYAASDFHAVYLSAIDQLDGPAAFLTELGYSPEYAISDLKSYLNLLCTRPFAGSKSIGERVIRAYAAAGEMEKARVTLSYLLALKMGDDALYRAAIEYFPEQAGAMFEAVRPYHPYEERPLIWLADLALQANDLDRSQELIDQAIALDPSDGEQGKDTRMQAYDVLSRLLRAKGNTEKADFFAEVMQAIRRGEEADDYLHAGLFHEAIRRYQEALGHFQDAYCLQSRLAKTLLQAGKVEESMVHFEKAFELMPVSFGPVESHCFGCEGIFDDPRVQEVAMKTFERVIGSSPQNPRTYYLLGLLLGEMKKPREAVVAMKKAMELDPRYYNCAKKLKDLLLQDPATVKEGQRMLPVIAGIAPYPDLQSIFQERTDLKQAWLEAQTPPPSPLKLEPLTLPFPAGRAGRRLGWQYFGENSDALDGWSTQELLKENSLAGWINDF